MTAQNSPQFKSGFHQLNIIGALLIVLLAASAWGLCQQPITIFTIIPLALIGFAAFKVVHELTFNRANVPTLATTRRGRTKITELLQVDAKSSTSQKYTIIDLGSGRGELSQRIARAIPKALVTGLEIARIPYLQSKFIQRWFGPANLSFQCTDFWHYDCTTTNAVYLYLTPRLAQRVGEKLAKELAVGSMVISHTFPLLGEWHPVDTIEFYTPFKEVIYVYRKSPA